MSSHQRCECDCQMFSDTLCTAHSQGSRTEWSSTFESHEIALISKLLYASPVWFGYLDKESRDQCQGLLNRLKRWGFLGKDFDNFIAQCENADDVLFSALLLNENHVLYQLLPLLKTTQYNIRCRPHIFTLP